VKGKRSTTERIAKVALEILEQEGPQAVTMRRVAKAVGVTPMAIYHHFPSREDLLKTITDAEFDKLLNFYHRRQQRDSAKSRDAKLLGLMDGYLDYAFARPQVFDYVFSNPRPDARRFPEDFRARQSPTLTPIADFIAEAMERGQLKKGDIWEVALEVWALAHGYLTLYRGGRFNLSEREFRLLFHRSMKRLFHGLKP